MLQHIDRNKFEPILYLKDRRGSFLQELPPDTRVFDGGGKRAATQILYIKRFLKAEAPDVIYTATNAMNIATLCATIQLSRSKRPLVVLSEHTSAKSYLKKAKFAWLRKKIIRNLYPKADLFTAPTQEILDEWSAMFMLSHVSQIALPNPILPATKIKQGKRQAFRVISAGRLVPVKGFDLLIEAMVDVARAHPNVRLSIYGEGPERKSLEGLISKLNLKSVVKLEGFTTRLPLELSKSQLAVFPSRREGFGNVVIEALGQGCQIIASDCPGPKSLLEPTGFGRIVPRNNVAALATSISELLTAPQYIDAIARQKFISPYKVTNSIALFESSIEYLAKNSTG